MRRTLVTNDVRGIPMLLMAFQHVMVMYAGAVAIPLVLGAALGLSKSDIAFLINADLFACGIVTIIQALGIGPVGIRMPVMMGVLMMAARNSSCVVGRGLAKAGAARARSSCAARRWRRRAWRCRRRSGPACVAANAVGARNGRRGAPGSIGRYGDGCHRLRHQRCVRCI